MAEHTAAASGTAATARAVRWDCHVHPFGLPGQYPVSPLAAYAEPEQTFDAYLAQLSNAGLNRSVLVQPSLYGDDNSALLDRLRNSVGGVNRGIIAPPPAMTEHEIVALHALGVRGIRLNLLSPGGNGVESVLPIIPRIREAGWHVAVHLDATLPGLLDDLVRAIDIPLVLDHMGRPPLDGLSGDMARFSSLLRQMERGRVFVKLSAPYQFSRQPSSYADVAPLAVALLRANPERVLFGSNWPHIGQTSLPGEVDRLVGITQTWLDTASVDAKQVFEINPEELYR